MMMIDRSQSAIYGMDINQQYFSHVLQSFTKLQEHLELKQLSKFQLQLSYLINMIPSMEDRKMLTEKTKEFYDTAFKITKDPDQAAFESGLLVVGLIMDYLNLSLQITKEDKIGMIGDDFI